MAKNTKIWISNGRNIIVNETVEQLAAQAMPHAPYHYILHLFNGTTIWMMSKHICYMEDLR
jgi:hypothetical protein